MASSLRCLLLLSLVCFMLSSFSEGARESMMFSKVTSAPAKVEPQVQPTASAQTERSDAKGENAVNAHDVLSETKKDASQLTSPSSSSEAYDVERQGLSDTRFLEGGKYFYDISNAERNDAQLEGTRTNWENVNNNGYGLYPQGESNRDVRLDGLPKSGGWVPSDVKGQGIADTRSIEGDKYFNNVRFGDQLDGVKMDTEKNPQTSEGYDLVSQDFRYNGFPRAEGGATYEEKAQGMSDTRSMAGGKYFYDEKAEGMRDTRSTEGAKYLYDGKSQGMSDTRSVAGGKYFYDVSADQRMDTRNPNYSGNGEYLDNASSYPQNVDDSSSQYFKNQNSEPERYVFDTMEEYEKYMESRHYKP